MRSGMRISTGLPSVITSYSIHYTKLYELGTVSTTHLLASLADTIEAYRVMLADWRTDQPARGHRETGLRERGQQISSLSQRAGRRIFPPHVPAFTGVV